MSANLAIVPPAASPVQQSIRFDDVTWCEITSLGLVVSKPPTDYEEWESLKPKLTVMEKGHQWGFGDWLVTGEPLHGEKVAQAIDAHDKTGVKVKTLMEYRRVSDRVPYSMRMESLEWTHHQIAANIKERALRRKWLQIAAQNEWTTEQLRKAIREAAQPSVNPDEPDTMYLDPHYKALLTDYIATQYSFLNRCNYDPFKAEIERTIKAAKYQLRRQAGTDRLEVMKQIDQGCATAIEVAEEVPLSELEIQKIFKWILENRAADYEERPIGAAPQLDNHHGSSTKGMFRKDAPFYDRSKGAEYTDSGADDDEDF